MRLLLAGLMISYRIHTEAATINWAEPIKVSGQADASNLWPLNRAYTLGSDHSVLINGINFTPLNAPSQQGDIELPGTIADGQTEIAVSGDRDGIFAERNSLADDLAVSPLDYRLLLGSGVSDGGSALALNLAGLTPGKTYLLQVWINDSRNTSSAETVAGGEGILTDVRFNPTEIHGDPGQYIIGVFMADDTQQTVTFTAIEGFPLINAFQLREAPDNVGLVIIQHPSSVANCAGENVKLFALATGGRSLTYLWQKVINGGARDLFDSDKLLGTTSNEMIIRDLSAADEGGYRVLVRDDTGSMSSMVTKVSILKAPDQLINVDINNGTSATYKGYGVLVQDSGLNIWNGIDGRVGFSNIPLVDANGIETSVTLTLDKPREDGYTRDNIQNDLLKDYSPATAQTVIVSHLQPEAYYNLVVYCIGRAPNEGGVLSGAVDGIVHGGIVENDFWVSRFLLGTNYIQNPFAKSDTGGILRFTIKATATVCSDGYVNGDLNGLQIMKVAAANLAPCVVRQPKTAAAYFGESLSLSANAIAPPPSLLTYQWQKISTNGIINLVDDIGLGGSTNQILVISNLLVSRTGSYRVVISDMYGSVTSVVAKVSQQSSPDLISVDIKNGLDSVPVYGGIGVLHVFGGNYWNGINGHSSFQDAPLLDSERNLTVVTISLFKDQVDSYTSPRTSNNLLKDYSCGHPQTVILKNLKPNCHYSIVVYSYGAMENEGGVFSGAITGIAHGWSGSPDGTTENFIKGINYVENNSVTTDANGTIAFTVQATSSVVTNGFYNADFNGLQIMRIE